MLIHGDYTHEFVDLDTKPTNKFYPGIEKQCLVTTKIGNLFLLPPRSQNPSYAPGFGDLVIGESTAKLAKFLSSVHAQYTMHINHQIFNSPIACPGYFTQKKHAQISLLLGSLKPTSGWGQWREVLHMNSITTTAPQNPQPSGHQLFITCRFQVWSPLTDSAYIADFGKVNFLLQ